MILKVQFQMVAFMNFVYEKLWKPVTKFVLRNSAWIPNSTANFITPQQKWNKNNNKKTYFYFAMYKIYKIVISLHLKYKVSTISNYTCIKEKWISYWVST